MEMLDHRLMTDRSYPILADRPEDRSLPAAISRPPLQAADEAGEEFRALLEFC